MGILHTFVPRLSFLLWLWYVKDVVVRPYGCLVSDHHPARLMDRRFLNVIHKGLELVRVVISSAKLLARLWHTLLAVIINTVADVIRLHFAVP